MPFYIRQRNKNTRLILTRHDVRVLRALGITAECIIIIKISIIVGTLLAARTVKGYSLAA